MKQIKRFLVMIWASVLGGMPICAQGFDDPSPRIRVIIDNDFAGDPDGVVALAHHLMSPSVDVRAVIASYFPMSSSPYGNREATDGAAIGVSIAKETVTLLGLGGTISVLQGSNTPMSNVDTPSESEVADFIIKQAMRTDTTSRLYICCGGSLNTSA